MHSRRGIAFLAAAKGACVNKRPIVDYFYFGAVGAPQITAILTGISVAGPNIRTIFAYGYSIIRKFKDQNNRLSRKRLFHETFSLHLLWAQAPLQAISVLAMLSADAILQPSPLLAHTDAGGAGRCGGLRAVADRLAHRASIQQFNRLERPAMTPGRPACLGFILYS